MTEGIIMVDETADEAEVLEWLHKVTQPPPFPGKGDQGPGKVSSYWLLKAGWANRRITAQQFWTGRSCLETISTSRPMY